MTVGEGERNSQALVTKERKEGREKTQGKKPRKTKETKFAAKRVTSRIFIVSPKSILSKTHPISSVYSFGSG